MDSSIKALTLQSLQSFKDAWQKEHDECDRRAKYIADLINEINARDNVIDVENIKSQLGLALMVQGGGKNPSIVPSTLGKILPESLQLLCCLRSGDSWISVYPNNNNDTNPVIHKFDNCTTFDSIVRSSNAGSIIKLGDMLPENEMKMVIGSNIEVVGISVFARCVWIVVGDKLNSNLVLEGAMSLLDYFSVLDYASQLTMSALVQHLEVEGMIENNRLCKFSGKFSSLLLQGSNPADVEQIWALLPAEFVDEFSDCSCDIYISYLQESGDSSDKTRTSLQTISSTLNLYSIMYKDPSTIPSILGTSILQQRTIVCNDIDNNIRNIVVDCDNSAPKGIICSPICDFSDFPTTLYVSVVCRWKNSFVSVKDIKLVEARTALIAPFIKSFLINTRFRLLFNRLTSPATITEMLDDTGVIVVDPTIERMRSMFEENTITAFLKPDTIDYLQHYLQCNWVLVLQSDDVFVTNPLESPTKKFDVSPLPKNLKILDNANVSREINSSSLTFRFRSFLSKLFKQSEDQLVEVVNGFDYNLWGLHHLMAMDDDQKALVSSLPAHFFSLIGFTLSNFSKATADNGGSYHSQTIVVLGGNYNNTISLPSMLPLIQKLQSIFDVASDFSMFKSVFSAQQQLEQQVLHLEHVKSISVVINSLKNSVFELDRDDSQDLYGKRIILSNFLRQLVIDVIKLCVHDVYVFFTSAFYVNEVTPKGILRRWKFHVENNKWMLSGSDDQSRNTLVTFPIYNEESYKSEFDTTAIEGRSFECEWIISFNNDDASLPVVLPVFDQSNIDSISAIVHEFVYKHSKLFFNLSESHNFYADGTYFFDIGMDAVEECLLNDKSFDSYINESSLLNEITKIAPFFVLAPIVINESRTSEESSIEIINAKNKVSIPRAIEKKVFEVVQYHISLLQTDNVKKDQSSMITLSSTLLYHIFQDAGIAENISESSIGLLYTRGFLSHNKAHYVQYFILTLGDALVFPSVLNQFRVLLDHIMLPLNFQPIIEPLRLTVDSLDTILHGCINHYAHDAEITKRLDNTMISAKYDGLTSKQDKYNFQNMTNFMEESIRLVREGVDMGTDIEVAFISCERIISKIVTGGMSLLGDFCVANLSFFIDEHDFMTLLYPNQDDLFEEKEKSDSSISASTKFHDIKTIQADNVSEEQNITYLPMCVDDNTISRQLHKTCRLQTQESIELELSNDIYVELDVVDIRDVNHLIRGTGSLLQNILSNKCRSNQHLRVIRITIYVKSQLFAPESRGKNNYTPIGAVLFWVIDNKLDGDTSQLIKKDDQFIHNFHSSAIFTIGKNVDINRIMRNSLLCLCNVTSHLLATVLTIAVKGFNNNMRTRKYIIDEVAHSLAYKSIMYIIEEKLAIHVMESNNSRDISPSDDLMRIQKCGYIDTMCTKVLNDLEIVKYEWNHITDRFADGVNINDQLQADIHEKQKQIYELSHFISAVYHSCFPQNTSDSVSDLLSLDSRALSAEGMMKVLLFIVFNNNLLLNCISLLCDCNQHEELTYQLRLVTGYFLHQKFDLQSEKNWLDHMEAFTSKLYHETKHNNEHIHIDDFLLVVWNLLKQPLSVVKGVASWDMMKQAFESGNQVNVGGKHHTRYLPIIATVSDAVVGVVQFHSHSDVGIYDKSIESNFTRILDFMANHLESNQKLSLKHHGSHSGATATSTGSFLSGSTAYDALHFMLQVTKQKSPDLLEELKWINDAAFLSCCSQLITTLLHTDACLFIPVTDVNGLKYEGIACRWVHGVLKCVDDPTVIAASDMQQYIQIDAPLKSKLFEEFSIIDKHHKHKKYILTITIPLTTRVEAAHDSSVVSPSVALLHMECDARPTEHSESMLQAVASIVDYIARSIDDSLRIRELEEKISHLEVTVHSTKVNVAQKAFASAVSNCESFSQIEDVVKNHLAILLDTTTVTLLLVQPSTVIDYEELVRCKLAASSDYIVPTESHTKADEAAAKCLVTNSIVCYENPLSDINEWSGAYAYIPVAYFPTTIKSKESIISSCVLKLHFTSIINWESFNHSKETINRGGELDKKEMGLQAAKLLRQWLKSHQYRLTQESSVYRLKAINDLSKQCTNSFQEIKSCLVDGLVSDWDVFGSLLTYEFSGNSRADAPAVICSARLHWQHEAEQMIGNPTHWNTCTIHVDNLENASEILNGVVNMRTFLRFQCHKVSHSPIPHKVLCDVVEDGVSLFNPFDRYDLLVKPGKISVASDNGDRKDHIWLSIGGNIGSNSTLAVLELQITPNMHEYIMCDEAMHTVYLFKEFMCQIGLLIERHHQSHSTLEYADIGCKLISHQLRILSLSLGELCHDGIISKDHDNIADLCVAIQSLLVQLPGVYSVSLHVVDTKSSDTIFSQEHISPYLNTSQSSINTPIKLDKSDSTHTNITSKLATLSPKLLSPTAASSAGSAKVIEAIRPGTEYLLECHDITGVLNIAKMNEKELDLMPTMNVPIKLYDSDEETPTIYMTKDYLSHAFNSKQYLETEQSLCQSIARALSRRMYELHKGVRNYHMMHEVQHEVELKQHSISELVNRMETLESSKAELVLKYELAQDEIELLRKELSDGKSVIFTH